jgi:hypothetical protein
MRIETKLERLFMLAKWLFSHKDIQQWTLSESSNLTGPPGPTLIEARRSEAGAESGFALRNH